MNPVHDRIGTGYAVRRRPDPRWARNIRDVLGGARTIVNLGAGAGAYWRLSRDAMDFGYRIVVGS